jgi:hypothetical protein
LDSGEPIVRTVAPSMTTSAVPLSMANSECPIRPSAASACPEAISTSDATLATAASSSSGKSANTGIAATREFSIDSTYTTGRTFAIPLEGRSQGRRVMVLGCLAGRL